MRKSLRVVSLVVALGGATLTAAPSTARAALALSLRAERSVPARIVQLVRAELPYLYRHIGQDLGAYPGRLTIELFSSHRNFAVALWREQRVRPQSTVDDSGSIVRGRLLLGPLPVSYLEHNLAHSYTEWLIDRLTGNGADTLPPETWLYDGLAEAEAYRYEAAGLHCSAGTHPFLDVTRLRTARAWLAARAGPLGPIAYCLASIKARRIIDRLGWPGIDAILRDSGGWVKAAHRIERLGGA